MEVPDLTDGVGLIGVTPNGPGADDIGMIRQNFKQLGVPDGVALQFAPPMGHPCHDAGTIGLEAAEQGGALVEGVAAVIIEADAPDGDHRLAPVVLVGFVAGDPGFPVQALPVRQHDAPDLPFPQAAQIIHQRPGAAGGL